jgi:GTP cyclohydrolase I
MMQRAVIALGSNIDPEKHIRLAVRLLNRCDGWSVERVSASYRSAAVGTDGPDFHNAAVLVETLLDPKEVRRRLRDIENRMGRVRTDDKYAPREIDLDLILYEGFEGEVEGTSIPDPGLGDQPYLTIPASEVAPDWEYPTGGQALKDLAATADREGLEVMSKELAPMDTTRRYAPESDMEATNGEIYDAEMESNVREMLVQLGEDPDREGLQRTPLRVAKALDFLTSGYTSSLETVVNNAVFESDADEMVVVKDIEFYSMCEHHMLPFFGKAAVAYLPNDKIIGLSKVARIVDMFARRFQVQERLTNQIADAMEEIMNPHGVAVVMEGSHFCMMMRGVQKQGSSMITSAMRGGFKSNSSTRAEFMELIKD